MDVEDIKADKRQLERDIQAMIIQFINKHKGLKIDIDIETQYEDFQPHDSYLVKINCKVSIKL